MLEDIMQASVPRFVVTAFPYIVCSPIHLFLAAFGAHRRSWSGYQRYANNLNAFAPWSRDRRSSRSNRGHYAKSDSKPCSTPDIFSLHPIKRPWSSLSQNLEISFAYKALPSGSTAHSKAHNSQLRYWSQVMNWTLIKLQLTGTILSGSEGSMGICFA